MAASAANLRLRKHKLHRGTLQRVLLAARQQYTRTLTNAHIQASRHVPFPIGLTSQKFRKFNQIVCTIYYVETFAQKTKRYREVLMCL